MRRVAVSGLVPCPPVNLADAFCDVDAGDRIWPGLVERSVLRSGDGWWECAVPVAGGATVALRYHRSAAAEVVVTAGAGGGYTVHRFLDAEGGCLWSVESHHIRRPAEPWMRFARRRARERDALEALIDAAAGYFAAHHDAGG